MADSVHSPAALPPGKDSLVRGVCGLGGTWSRSDMTPTKSVPLGVNRNNSHETLMLVTAAPSHNSSGGIIIIISIIISSSSSSNSCSYGAIHNTTDLHFERV